MQQRRIVLRRRLRQHADGRAQLRRLRRHMRYVYHWRSCHLQLGNVRSCLYRRRERCVWRRLRQSPARCDELRRVRASLRGRRHLQPGRLPVARCAGCEDAGRRRLR
jgi:hypothetical protein